MDIILASSSKSRRKQLDSLDINFTVVSPDIDETPKSGESAKELVLRLAAEKVAVVAAKQPQALIIAGDQVCVLDGKIIGKPHTQENAIAQLQASSGKTIRFYSGLCVHNSETCQQNTIMVPTDVTFRKLSLAEIESYVNKAKPLYCAGSFNVEGLGIVLFEKIISDDPSALIGLPLISVVSFLKQFGVKF